MHIKSILEPYGILLSIAEHFEDLQNTISQKIENMIKECDVALILLTENGFNSNFVQQEIGYIKSQERPMLTIVQSGIEHNITGFIFGRGYILYEPEKPQLALEKLKRSLLGYLQHMEAEKLRQLELIRQENHRRENETKIGIMILAGLVILALSGSSS